MGVGHQLSLFKKSIITESVEATRVKLDWISQANNFYWNIKLIYMKPKITFTATGNTYNIKYSFVELVTQKAAPILHPLPLAPGSLAPPLLITPQHLPLSSEPATTLQPPPPSPLLPPPSPPTPPLLPP
jgi:hypothetical protein